VTSIRTFLVVVLISTITFVSFLTALHGYRQSLKQADRLFEDQLRQQAYLLTINASNKPQVNIDPYISNNAYQIFDIDKKLLLRSLNSPVLPISEFSPGFSTSNFSGYRWHTFVTYNASQQNWIMVAERIDVRNQLADAIIMESIFPIVASIPVTAILIWLIVSFGLKPIHKLATQLGSKQASDLTPIAIDTIPGELMTLATSANDLLQRLESSFAREKRFNSDVAHELRTPIAALNIHLQNLLCELDNPPESARKLDQGLRRLNHLVEQIILLNRMTPDHYVSHFTNIDLSDVTRNVMEELLDEINTKHQDFKFEGHSCVVAGDAFAIGTMIKNLTRNAIKYTPEYGKIIIRIREKNDNCVLQVMDNGPGIPADEYEQVFERFYRLGGDRHSSTSTGCGLGLSIVKYIAELHHATLHLETSEFSSGLLFSISFPKTNPTATPD